MGAVVSVPGFPHLLQQEADHRVANSLQIISSLVRRRARSGSIGDPQLFLMEIADRIDAIGSLHMFLARSTTGTIPLAGYLNEICTRLNGALAQTSAVFDLDCPADCHLPARTAVSLALMVAELISNSLKYAHPTGLPTKITLACRPDETGELKIVYEDDGVGFPESFDLSETGHMGMRFIDILTKSVRGTHKWYSDPLGIRFEISLPIES